jgi:hypothetical protein
MKVFVEMTDGCSGFTAKRPGNKCPRNSRQQSRVSVHRGVELPDLIGGTDQIRSLIESALTMQSPDSGGQQQRPRKHSFGTDRVEPTQHRVCVRKWKHALECTFSGSRGRINGSKPQVELDGFIEMPMLH